MAKKDSNDTERGRGQPRAFATENDFKEKFIEYIRFCIDGKRFPNIAGFCAYTWITRETFYKQEEYYSDMYNKIRCMLEDEVLQDNTYRAQLYLKNTFGYKDKIETENINLNHDLTEDEADEILRRFK